MSQGTRTRPAEPSACTPLDGLDGPGGGPSVSGADVLNRLWRFFISMRTGLWLILALGVLMQVPAGMGSDAATHTSRIASIHSKYGGWTPVLELHSFFGDPLSGGFHGYAT